MVTCGKIVTQTLKIRPLWSRAKSKKQKERMGVTHRYSLLTFHRVSCSCCSCFHIFCSRYFDGGGSFCFRPEMIKLSRDGSGLLTSHQDHTNAYPYKACECGRQDSWMAYGTLAFVFLYWKIGTGLKKLFTDWGTITWSNLP